VGGRIPEGELVENAGRARLVYANPLLERIALPAGGEAYLCPWDRVALFRGRLGVYRITVPSWITRAWCEAGCNHFWVYVMRRFSPEALRVRIHGKRVYAVLEGPSVTFVIASRVKGLGGPWLP